MINIDTVILGTDAVIIAVYKLQQANAVITILLR
jgi:hypothetical protein